MSELSTPRVEDVWRGLRDALGPHGVGPVLGLEDTRRWVDAELIADGIGAVEAALAEFFPATMFWNLPMWERTFALDGGGTLDERREAIGRRLFTASARNAPAPLMRRLWEDYSADLTLDPRPAWDETHYIMLGKVLADDVNELTNPLAPNVATGFVTRFTWHGATTDQIDALKADLNDSLPAWQWFSVAAGSFVIGTGRLGYDAI